MRFTTILIGSAVLILSILAMFVLGRVLNPPAQQVYVAVREIQAGETLAPELLRLASVRLPSTEPYLTETDIDEFGFATVVETVHEGMFIPKADLSFSGNPAALNRVSLSLSDPNLVAMTIPVTPLTSPGKIVSGDRVSLNVSIGSAAFTNPNFSTIPTNDPNGRISSIPPTLPSPFTTPQPTQTPEPRISLPVTKNLVVSGRVLDVVYEEKFSPAVNMGEQPDGGGTERGDIQALVVAVPRSIQEALAFAIATGEVRVAVLDPNAPDSAEMITAGMSWEDLVAYFRWQRESWLLTPQPLDHIDPPGAAALVPTLAATYHPTATPFLQEEKFSDMQETSDEDALGAATPTITARP